MTAAPTAPTEFTRWIPEHLAALRVEISGAIRDGVGEAVATLAAAQIKPVTVGLKGVTAMTGKSRADVYRSMAANKFPRPVDDGTGAARWRVKDIERWAEGLKPKK